MTELLKEVKLYGTAHGLPVLRDAEKASENCKKCFAPPCFGNRDVYRVFDTAYYGVFAFKCIYYDD